MVAFNVLGHLIIVSIVGILVAPSPLYMSAMIIGTLMPDIDHQDSTLGRYNPFVGAMRHRGHCHSLVGAGLICLPFLFWGFQFYKYTVIGAIVHILADVLKSKLTERPLPLKVW